MQPVPDNLFNWQVVSIVFQGPWNIMMRVHDRSKITIFWDRTLNFAVTQNMSIDCQMIHTLGNIGELLIFHSFSKVKSLRSGAFYLVNGVCTFFGIRENCKRSPTKLYPVRSLWRIKYDKVSASVATSIPQCARKSDESQDSLRGVVKNGYFMVWLTIRGGGPDRKQMWKL